MKDIILKNKKPNKNKLIEYGFKKQNKVFVYSKNILEDEFELTITIDENQIKTSLTETSTGELYTLHLIEGVKGAFVGKVKQAYEAVLQNVADKCFEINVFKSLNSHKVIDYAYTKYGDEVEYLWEKFPENAICRRKDNQKWYFAILTCKRGKLGEIEPSANPDEVVEVIDLRANSEELPNLIKQDNIYPGYHMNKKHWISIVLDGSVDIKTICSFIDKSYDLAGKK